VVVLLAADTAFGVVTVYGPYQPGGPIDAGSIGFPPVCAAAALHPSIAVGTSPSAPVTPRRRGRRLVLLSGAAILAPAVQMLEDRLAPELETILYRIMQESLTNVAKHAQAGHVAVTVDQLDDDTVRLRVRDDGVGFDASNAARLLREGHFGLAGMRERASLVGGSLEVGSVPGNGTTVEVRLPMQLSQLEGLRAP
jgi:signal transduction histidine kinase